MKFDPDVKLLVLAIIAELAAPGNTHYELLALTALVLFIVALRKK